jgi:RimJ/RimL family protein N-acetyltransferase
VHLIQVSAKNIAMSSFFESARLVYRAIEEEDEGDKAFILSLQRDTAATANSDPRLMRPRTKNAPDGFIQWMKDESLISVLICLPESADNPLKPIGFIKLEKIKDQEHHRKGIIGVGIAAGHQGKGYGGEAIRWILEWGFQAAGLHRIAIACFSFNEGARRLYEKLHFVYEGKERESIWASGGWHDIIWLSILEREWREKYTDVGDGKEAVVASS